MSRDWAPPPITISGRSKKLPDFVNWMVQVPVVSEKARSVLSPMIGDYVQFLPFHELKRKRYYALNVTCVETSILSEAKSGIRYRDGAGKEPMSLDRAAFDVDPSYKLPPIFKVSLPQGPVFSDVYVARPFADIAIEHRLTGFELADPSEVSRLYIIEGRSQNVVPGIVG
jgi:hypothetical protein